MGIVFASMGPLNLLPLPTLDQSCVDIRTPSYRTCRASVKHASGGWLGSLLLLYDSLGKSFDVSSTTGTTSCTASAGPVDVLIIPSGTGITSSPLTIVLGLE